MLTFLAIWFLASLAAGPAVGSFLAAGLGERAEEEMRNRGNGSARQP